MDYPRTPIELDRRIKINPDEIELIKAKYVGGQSMRSLAKDYEVSVTTIWLTINPEKKLEANKRAREYKHRRWFEKGEEAELWRAKQRVLWASKTKYKKKILPETQKYYAERMKPEYWKRSNKKRWQQIKDDEDKHKTLKAKQLIYNKMWREKNREKLRAYSRARYIKLKNK